MDDNNDNDDNIDDDDDGDDDDEEGDSDANDNGDDDDTDDNIDDDDENISSRGVISFAQSYDHSTLIWALCCPLPIGIIIINVIINAIINVIINVIIIVFRNLYNHQIAILISANRHNHHCHWHPQFSWFIIFGIVIDINVIIVVIGVHNLVGLS